MYVFSGLLLLGLLITYQKPYSFLLLAVLVAVQSLRARQEASVLEAKFGGAYREYRKKTWF
jgi:protein-S-isoprenylcysteine O-methyltransferase Ste14